MLRITAPKVAQMFSEHSELRDEYARDTYEEQQYDKYNVYFIRETFIDPTTGQETGRISDDGYTSVDEASSIARSSLQDSIDEGAIEVDIVHKDEGLQQSIWSSEDPQPMLSFP